MGGGSIAWWLLPFILATGLLHIQAEYAGARQRVYLFKPLTTSLIIVFALLVEPPAANYAYKWLVVIGLCFSLSGDIFLMLPQDRFVAGLVSFLLAHIVYIAAFSTRHGFIADMPALTAYAIYGVAVVSLLWQGLGTLRISVLFYVAVILVMGWQALAVWRSYPTVGTLSAALGAASFVVSDSTLALDRFRHPFVAARGLVLSTYYLAQTLIALSIMA